jgi:hypothetical protein
MLFQRHSRLSVQRSSKDTGALLADSADNDSILTQKGLVRNFSATKLPGIDDRQDRGTVLGTHVLGGSNRASEYFCGNRNHWLQLRFP